VLSAIGFSPVCPGSPVYEIGSPIFAKTTIRLGNGQEVTIIANHVSAQNKYIQSAKLNRKPLNQAWFHHSDIANGGTLVLEMGDKPNTAWGSALEGAPPSASQEGAPLPQAE
jgi:putative alpha-1,2-mannosidase